MSPGFGQVEVMLVCMSPVSHTASLKHSLLSGSGNLPLFSSCTHILFISVLVCGSCAHSSVTLSPLGRGPPPPAPCPETFL